MQATIDHGAVCRASLVTGGREQRAHLSVADWQVGVWFLREHEEFMMSLINRWNLKRGMIALPIMAASILLAAPAAQAHVGVGLNLGVPLVAPPVVAAPPYYAPYGYGYAYPAYGSLGFGWGAWGHGGWGHGHGWGHGGHGWGHGGHGWGHGGHR
jgi:hypothetical protein